MAGSDFQCPECGAEVHPNARGCRNCGARKEGNRWFPSESYDGVDLPGGDDDDFDYDDFIAREFGDGSRLGRRQLSKKEKFWAVVAAVTLIAFICVFVL